MSKIFYIADLHLDHKKILEVERSGFSSLEEMRGLLLDNWNASVNKEDDVYILGDVSFKMSTDIRLYLKSLRGRKHLIIGNHDNYNAMLGASDIWAETQFHAIITDGSKRVSLCHYPMESWPSKFYGVVHIHGHTHENYWEIREMMNRYNAWCMALDMCPRTLDWFIENYGYSEHYYRQLSDRMGGECRCT